jgi:hypothetical protein
MRIAMRIVKHLSQGCRDALTAPPAVSCYIQKVRIEESIYKCRQARDGKTRAYLIGGADVLFVSVICFLTQAAAIHQWRKP